MRLRSSEGSCGHALAWHIRSHVFCSGTRLRPAAVMTWAWFARVAGVAAQPPLRGRIRRTGVARVRPGSARAWLDSNDVRLQKHTQQPRCLLAGTYHDTICGNLSAAVYSLVAA